MGRAVKQSYVQPVAGRFESVGVIDLGVVQIKLTGAPWMEKARIRVSIRMSRFCRR